MMATARQMPKQLARTLNARESSVVGEGLVAELYDWDTAQQYESRRSVQP